MLMHMSKLFCYAQMMHCRLLFEHLLSFYVYTPHCGHCCVHLQTLEVAVGKDGVMLLDNSDQVLDFVEQIRDKSHLTWATHVGGGNSYKCLVYAQSNAAQMCTTDIDMLKAALLSSESFHILLHAMQAFYCKCNMDVLYAFMFHPWGMFPEQLLYLAEQYAHLGCLLTSLEGEYGK